MRGRRGLHVVRVLAAIVVAFVVFALVTMELWNWLIPAIFGLRAITFAQAIGLVLLSKILFGGLHAPWAGRRRWREQMQERWAQMTPQERERFRQGMSGRCDWRRDARSVPEQKTV